MFARNAIPGARVAFGVLLFCALGCDRREASASAPSVKTVTATVDGKPALVAITADEKGFTPSAVEIHRGTAATLVFTRTTDDTCAKEVVFPELKLTKELPLHQKVTFDVPSSEAHTLTFQCGMGMFKGKIVVL